MSSYSKKAYKSYLYTQDQAFLKWKRMSIRHRELQSLKGMSNIEMPLSVKRRIAREAAYYAGTSNYQPLKPLDVYDYTSENELLSDTGSYSFGRSPLAGKLTQERSSSVEDSTLDQTEEVDESSISRSSEAVNSSSTGINESNRSSSTPQISESNKSSLSPTEPEEDEFYTAHERIQEVQATPERSRRSVDCDSEMISLSPALSALKITRESGKECESEKSIEVFSRNSSKSPISRIDENIVSNEVGISQPPDRVEINSSRMLLIPSNVRPKVRELALKFAKHFHYGAKERDADKGSLDVRVSHVIMDRKIPDPFQFAQIQAIGCKRYLVSAKWLRDSLKADQILSEDSYDILDPPFLEPSRRARLSPKNLFRGFAIIMCKPFVSVNQSEIEQLLSINGAQIYYHPKEFANSPNLARLCVVDAKYYRKGKLCKLLKLKKKKYKFVVVRYEWLHNSFIMYQLRPILKYLLHSEREEALEVGVPPKFLED